MLGHPNHPMIQIRRTSASQGPQSALPPLSGRKKPASKAKLPPIVLPLLSPNQQKTSLSQPRTVTNQGITYKQRNYPQTPHPQISVDINPIIERCKLKSVFKIIEIGKSDEKLDPQKLESLNLLIKITGDPLSRHNLTASALENLFFLITDHIFRPLQQSPSVNPYGESLPSYTITHWKYIESCHLILQNLLIDVHVIDEFISKTFIRTLMLQLQTPIIAEQKLLEKELIAIFYHGQSSRHQILKRSIARLISYLDDQSPYFGISSILELFHMYYKNLSRKFNRNDHLLFRAVIFPLVTKHATEFSKSLYDLTSLFIDANADWCFNFLLLHWPLTQTPKQAMFLNLLETLLSLIQPSTLQKLLPKLIAVVSEGVSSGSNNVRITALLMTNSPEFIGLCHQAPIPTSKLLIPALVEMQSHWKEDRRAIADDMLEQLASCRVPIPPSDSEAMWKIISEAAASHGHKL